MQSTCDPWVQTLIRLGKPWGFYHFMNDDNKNSGAKEEAEFFVRHCRNYFGKGIPVADYEGPAKKFGTRYLQEFLDTVFVMTGVKPMVYCSLSVLKEQDFSKIARAGYPLWIAQYANTKTTGIQETPWQQGPVLPFEKYRMHQYSDCGRLNGYNALLDLNKFYGTIEDWDELARVSSASIIPVVDKKVGPEIVQDVLTGKYSDGVERVMRLREAGYDPKEVQHVINDLYNYGGELIRLKHEAGVYFEMVKKIAGI